MSIRGWKFWLGLTLVALVLIPVPIAYKQGAYALHPARRALSPAEIAQASLIFERVGATQEDFSVRAEDGALLRGWIAYPTGSEPRTAPRDWVLLFHGVSDNRLGVLGFATFLLRHGYCVTMMDSRAHGESEGSQATYGWLERRDTRDLVNRLVTEFRVRQLFAMGVSMGASIALESAADDARIEGVVAEAPFSSLREASYDYVGLHRSPLLGRTLLWPAVAAGIYAMQREGKFSVDEISPERAVGKRSFPILLIADGQDTTLPPRYARRIYAAAAGAKQLWVVPGASHASGFGAAPAEYERRVLAFFTGMPARRATMPVTVGSPTARPRD